MRFDFLASPLTEIGILLQVIGSLMIGFPIWRAQKGSFDTSKGIHIGSKGNWPRIVLVGFWLYMSGYLLLFLDIILKNTN
jgi:hypothetical protein